MHISIRNWFIDDCGEAYRARVTKSARLAWSNRNVDLTERLLRDSPFNWDSHLLALKLNTCSTAKVFTCDARVGGIIP